MAPLQPTDYFNAALDLMGSVGAAQVTIDNLCEVLQVTKGSFYHHFEGRSEFMRRTLVFWEHEHGSRLASEARGVADPRTRIDVLQELATHLNHQAERAIRGLAATDTFADEVLRRVDRERRAVVAQAFTEAGMAAEAAGQLADVGLAILVGSQETGAFADRDRIGSLLGHYRRWVESEVAGPR